MQAATGFTPLLVNFESMTSKPNAGGAAKTASHGKVEKAVHYFGHKNKVTTDSSTDWGKQLVYFYLTEVRLASRVSKNHINVHSHSEFVDKIKTKKRFIGEEMKLHIDFRKYPTPWMVQLLLKEGH